MYEGTGTNWLLWENKIGHVERALRSLRVFVISTVQIAHRYLYLTLRQQSSQKERCWNRLQYSREALLSFKSTQRNMKEHKISLSKCWMYKTLVMSCGHNLINKRRNLKYLLPPHIYESLWKTLYTGHLSTETHYSTCALGMFKKKKNVEQCNKVTFVEWHPMLAVINR